MIRLWLLALVGTLLLCTVVPWWAAVSLLAPFLAWRWHVAHRGTGLDPQRFFANADRDIIYNRAGGRCQWPGCGVLTHYETNCPLGGCDDCYQADHVIPWSKGGVTGLTNGACLCARHNRLKSNH